MARLGRELQPLERVVIGPVNGAGSARPGVGGHPAVAIILRAISGQIRPRQGVEAATFRGARPATWAACAVSAHRWYLLRGNQRARPCR